MPPWTHFADMVPREWDGAGPVPRVPGTSIGLRRKAATAHRSNNSDNSDDDRSAEATTAAKRLGSERADATAAARNHSGGEPILVHIYRARTHFRFGFDTNFRIEQCVFRGAPLDCRWSGSEASLLRADAVWHDGTFHASAPILALPARQLAVASTGESQFVAEHTRNDSYLNLFDAFQGLRMKSVLPLSYYMEVHDMRAPPLPTSAKRNAVVALVTKCHTHLNRTAVLRELVRHGVEVHFYGRCMKTHAMPSLPPVGLSFDERVRRSPFGAHDRLNVPDSTVGRSFFGKFNQKVALFRTYKFCVCMENSASRDYVTEKIFNALEAGCVPVYYGAPNVRRYVPDDDAYLDLRQFGNDAGALAAEIKRLAADDAAYERMLEWKRRAPETWKRSFRQLRAYGNFFQRDWACHVCQYVAARRERPRCRDCLGRQWLGMRAEDWAPA